MGKEVVSLFQIYEKEDATKLIMNATRELREARDSRVDKDFALSAKAQEIKELCISYGPSGAKLARICSILLGEKITIKEIGVPLPFFQFACVVPLRQDNHDYKIKEPCFMLSCDGSEKTPSGVKCIRIDGSVGASLKTMENIIDIPGDKAILGYIDKIFKFIEETEMLKSS